MDVRSDSSWSSPVKQLAGRNDFLAHVAQLGGGTALGQGLVLLTAPAVTHLYSPAEIGLVGLFTAFLLLAAGVASLRYEFAICVAPAQDRDLVALLSCWLALPVGLVSAAVMGALIAADAFGFGALPYWSAVAMLPLVVVTGVLSALRFWYVARKDFGSIASALIGQGFGRALVPVLVAPLGWGWGGLLAGEAAGRALGFHRLVRTAGPALAAAHRLGPRGLYACLVRYCDFPLTFLPSGLLESATAALPLPLVASLFGVPAAGLFALALQVMLVPGALICRTLADVYQARLVDAVRQDPNSLHVLLKSGAIRLALLATALYLPIAVVAPISFRWVFGVHWSQAGQAAAALAPFAISGVITNPLSRAILMSRTPQVKLLSDACRLVMPCGGLYLAGWLGLPFVQSILVYSVLGLAANCIYLGVIWYSVAPVRQRQFG